MDNENSAKYDNVYSNIVKAGKRRKYFFDVKTTKGGDYYITLTESTRKFQGEGYERHKIFLYKEDFNQFLEALEETITHVKTELMPDYDYDQYNQPYDPELHGSNESSETSTDENSADSIDEEISW